MAALDTDTGHDGSRAFALWTLEVWHARGGGNPLGPRALYLYKDGKDTLYRLHGTVEPETIGTKVSSGCVRMLNQDIIDLFDRVPVRAKVVVLPSDPNRM